MKRVDIFLTLSVAFFCVVMLAVLCWSFWIEANPPPQQPYRSEQVIRIEIVNIQKSEKP